ncbi:alcohol dehydrogenase catalytic domain-containing protein [Streptomyces sp. NPDC001658]
MPAPGPGEVLVEVRAAGVCLSDAHLIDGSISPAFSVDAVAKTCTVTLGHEVAGVIHAVGPEVAGDGSPVLGRCCRPGACGGCGACLRRASCRQPQTRGVDYDGGWAECAVAREDALIALPDDLPFGQAAIIPDAVSTPYAAIVETVRYARRRGSGSGAGGLGAHGIRLARVVGAAPVIAVVPLPRARGALAFGADLALDPTADGFAEASFLWVS